MQDMSMRAIEHFEAVARLGTVTKAAIELGITPSAISQQIKLLEAQLGITLFRREKKRLALTLDGDRFFQATTQALTTIRNAKNTMTCRRNTRNLTIRVSPSFGVRWLGPRIRSFADANPEWSIRINATTNFTVFDAESVDVELRYGSGDWSGLAVNNIMHEPVLPLCSPDYLDKLRSLSNDPREQIRHARLIDSVKMLYPWDAWLSSNRITATGLNFAFRFDRSSMSIEMAKQGGGLAFDSAVLCLPELQRGELVPFSTGFDVVNCPAHWFVCPPQHFNRRIVHRFWDWITEMATQHDTEVRSLLNALGCKFRPVG